MQVRICMALHTLPRSNISPRVLLSTCGYVTVVLVVATGSLPHSLLGVMLSFTALCVCDVYGPAGMDSQKLHGLCVFIFFCIVFLDP